MRKSIEIRNPAVHEIAGPWDSVIFAENRSKSWIKRWKSDLDTISIRLKILNLCRYHMLENYETIFAEITFLIKLYFFIFLRDQTRIYVYLIACLISTSKISHKIAFKHALPLL